MKYLAEDFELLRDGKCLGTIPGTFIACGEEANFCSKMCQIKEAFRVEARKFHSVGDLHDNMSLNLAFLRLVKEHLC